MSKVPQRSQWSQRTRTSGMSRSVKLMILQKRRCRLVLEPESVLP